MWYLLYIRRFFLTLGWNLDHVAFFFRSINTQCTCTWTDGTRQFSRLDYSPACPFGRTTLYCLSRSDVLLNAWSYFSHVATFLSEGDDDGAYCNLYSNSLSKHHSKLISWLSCATLMPQGYKYYQTPWARAQLCIWTNCAGPTRQRSVCWLHATHSAQQSTLHIKFTWSL